MLYVFAFFLAILIVYLTYAYRILFRVQRKLKWVPSTTLVPFFGSAFEFGTSTELVDDLDRLTNNPRKSFYNEFGFHEYGILTRDHDLVEFVLSSNHLIEKSTDYDYLKPWLGTGLVTSGGTKWKQRRRISTPAFHFSILEQFVDVFDANGKIMVNNLLREAADTDSVDIYTYLTACTLDIISETAMGVSVNCQSGKNTEYVQAVKDMCKIMSKRGFSIYKASQFLFSFTQDYKNQQKAIKVLHNFTNSVIESRIEKLKNKVPVRDNDDDDDSFGKKRRLAFLDLLLSSTVEGKPMTLEAIREEVDTVMFAGHDTTSFVSSMALYLLANHPEVQRLARNEQKDIFGQDRDRPITHQDLQKMKYLDLVVKESLRLYPSIPVIGRIATEDINYKEHIIPKDTVISIYIYGINRDPDYYESPDEFIPERFLNSDGKRYFSYVPFSAGPRNCLGQKFAQLEMKSLLSLILRNFEILPTHLVHKPILAMEAVFKAINGVKIKLKKYNWHQ